MARDSNIKDLLYRLNRKSVEVLTEARVNQMWKTVTSVSARVRMMVPTVRNVL